MCKTYKINYTQKFFVEAENEKQALKQANEMLIERNTRHIKKPIDKDMMHLLEELYNDLLEIRIDSLEF